MLIVLAQTNIVVIDSSTTLLLLLNNIISLAVDPPLLYLNLEGVKLSCYGFISKKIYLIDIHRFRKTAFLTTNSSTTSLKTILESLTIPKVFFNIRNNLDALFSHF